MGIRTKLIAAMVAATALTGMAGTVAASAGPAAPASPTASAPSGDKKDGDKKDGDKKDGDKKDGDKKDKDAIVAKVAASLHVTVRQLVTALDHLKQAIGNGTDKADAVAAFAKELKVSVADAQKALQALSSDDNQKPKPGKDKGVPEEVVKLLATELHISADRARQVFKDLDKVNGKSEDIVKDPAFIAIAKGLGITPQRLVAALVKVKQEVVGKEKGKAPSGSPTK